MKTTILKDVSRERLALSDIKTLRARARQHIEKGAVTAGYAAERETVVKLLNEALATEIVCVLRYKRHHFMAAGIHAAPVAGAAGGAFAVGEIEKLMKTTRHYEVIMRLENGGTQAIPCETDPAFEAGDKVRVENNTLIRNP